MVVSEMKAGKVNPQRLSGNTKGELSLLFLVHVLGGLTLALNGTCLHSLLQKSIRGMD